MSLNVSAIVALLAFAVCGCSLSPHKKLSNRIVSDRMLEFAGRFSESGQEDEAIKYLKHSIKKSPGNLVAHEQLADLYLKTGQTELAAKQLEQAIAGTSDRHHLHIRLGKLYLQDGKILAANRQAELAIQMDSTQTRAWELAGDIHAEKREWGDAANAYQRALSLAPKDSTISLKLCQIYLKTERPLEALATLEQLNLGENPALLSPEIHLLHGTVLTELRNYRQAIAVLQRACDHESTGGEAYLRLSNALLLDGREQEARATLIAAQQRFPEMPVFTEILTTGGSPLRPSIASRE